MARRRSRPKPPTRPQLTRSLQVGFLVLLGLCSAQLAYWLADEASYTAAMQAQIHAAYLEDAAAAQAMLRGGSSAAELIRLHPDLAVTADSAVVVSPAVLAALDDQRFHRLNRYMWEGAFFLAVLLAAMAVVYRALREEADLRRLQQHFLDAVSHELKSPLASLRLSAETLALRDPPPERRAELIRRMLADLGRLERMDTNVLEASRLEAGEVAGEPVPVELAAELAAVVEEAGDQARELGVSIATDVPAGLAVMAGEERVRLVLRNLLHNAIRAAAGAGHVTVTAAAADGTVALQVRDDGVGFPPELARRLFERFYRVEGADPAPAGGTGLGLYLVQRCAELDHGTVAAASEGPGRGAAFSVTWPAAAGGPAPGECAPGGSA